MKRTVRSSLTTFALLAAAAAALAYFLWPAAIEAELAVAALAPMQVTIDEDGRTRVKDRYVVSAPLDGELLRVGVRAGDRLEAGKTILASILPKPPDMLDARVRGEAEAKVRVAEAAHLQAERRLAEAREAHELARHLFERARRLLSTRTITTEEFETVEHKERIAAEAMRSAEFGQQVARFEVDLARAALLRTRPASSVAPRTPTPEEPAHEKLAHENPMAPSDADERLEIRSPITGQVFRVLQENAMVVRSGAALVEVGDTRDLEIEVDLLSSDAVRVKPGAKMLLEHWGGERPLVARVRLIEPSGFTKVSALGVEEQRVNVIADFVDDVEHRPQLGDGFRVEARVVEWETNRALIVPAGAVFRLGDEWAVYVVHGNRARLKTIQVGHHNGSQAEVLTGLEAGERVVLHPSDRMSDGARIRVR